MLGFHQGQKQSKAGYMEAILFSYTDFLSCNTGRTIYDPRDSSCCGQVKELARRDFWVIYLM